MVLVVVWYRLGGGSAWWEWGYTHLSAGSSGWNKKLGKKCRSQPFSIAPTCPRNYFKTCSLLQWLQSKLLWYSKKKKLLYGWIYNFIKYLYICVAHLFCTCIQCIMHLYVCVPPQWRYPGHLWLAVCFSSSVSRYSYPASSSQWLLVDVSKWTAAPQLAVAPHLPMATPSPGKPTPHLSATPPQAPPLKGTNQVGSEQ